MIIYLCFLYIINKMDEIKLKEKFIKLLKKELLKDKDEPFNNYVKYYLKPYDNYDGKILKKKVKIKTNNSFSTLKYQC